jgi:CRISPR-associated protein Cmr2
MVDRLAKDNSSAIAIAWCLAWGEDREPQHPLSVLQQMRQALIDKMPIPEAVQSVVKQVQTFQDIPKDYFPEKLLKLQQEYDELWNQDTSIGLVYGGATKIKQYVFESAKLPDIRGASALLDRINSVDLPAFFNCESDQKNYPQCAAARDYCSLVREHWLEQSFTGLSNALIPELVIYATGGNILAFCPAAFVNDLANAIEKRYTHETLTANSCAVGSTFRLMEVRFGQLQKNFEQTFWLEEYLKSLEHPLVKAYYEQPNTLPEEAFRNRKSFNELVGQLAAHFNRRRSGNDNASRPSHRYPPMFETHPYLRRDDSDRRSAVMQAIDNLDGSINGLPGDPWLSEVLARKRLVGQIAKRDSSQKWYQDAGFDWQPGEAFESWVNKFEKFLYQSSQTYYGQLSEDIEEARSVREIADASTPKGYIAYIYADGNNMGGYIQKQIKTPEGYKRFSRDIFEATEQSVYTALAKHLRPYQYQPDATSRRHSKQRIWIHPFEILTIGGDDVMLIVQADKALAIAQTIGEEFESILKQRGYATDKSYPPENIHRFKSEKIPTGQDQCELSMSVGVLITAEDTPIYYAEHLTNQLLKSAKKQAKHLKQEGYYGGTIDFLVMKSVTMISSNITEFRNQGLTHFRPGQPKLKLYAAPYTLYELGGLLETAKVLKAAQFPRSQLYQIRSLLPQSKRTAILNYRYFRKRLANQAAKGILEKLFEEGWCKPKSKDNSGNLAPWMSLQEVDFNATPSQLQKMTYETIWRELVDLYPFTETQQDTRNQETQTELSNRGITGGHL